MDKFEFRNLGDNHKSLDELYGDKEGKIITFSIEGVPYLYKAKIGDITRGSMPDQEIGIHIDVMISVEKI